MNESFPRSGREHYTHLTGAGEQLWGFWDVQRKTNDESTLLVHTTFARPNLAPETSDYVWELIEQRGRAQRGAFDRSPT